MCKCLKIFSRKSKNPSGEDDNDRNNTPDVIVPPLPETLSEEEKKNPILWYPDRIITAETKKLKMRTRGYYQGGFPSGALIHDTSGRSRPKATGGKRNSSTAKGQAMRSVRAGCKSNYTYFIIDADGNVYQQFPLNRYGYHSGSSSFPGVSGNVHSSMVGIEVMCAGKLKPHSALEAVAWFTKLSKGDATFKKDEYSVWENDENIVKGIYHDFTDKQKEALVKLLLWLDAQSELFSLDRVAAHDEVSPGRKVDPGGSLGMTISNFREMLKDIKAVEAS